MTLQTYIDLYQLLQQRHRTHASSRAFALERQLTGKPAVQKLLAWVLVYREKLPIPSVSKQLCKYLYGISVVLGVLALVLGFLTGIGLLSYSGKAPVNVIYFLAVSVFIPLMTMILGLFSMLRVKRAQNLLVHISPAFWMERVLHLFSRRMQVPLSEVKITPLLLNWLVIKRAQLLALLFALGLLLALLGIVATKDIAFGWSTTLQVSAEQFHTILNGLALPWREWLPSAVPSIELIEKSHYFRLGEKLDSVLVANVQLLGEWWKFLVCATFFYAIVLRVAVWLIAQRGFVKALLASSLSLEGVETLLHEMETPLVSTTASRQEIAYIAENPGYERVVYTCNPHYRTVFGWAMNKEEVLLLNDTMGIVSAYLSGLGGIHTPEEDSRIIQRAEGEVLLYVKSWEPPTMDLMDLLTELAVGVESITLLPVGTAAEGYDPTPRELDIWERKLQLQDLTKVWLCRIS